MDRYYFDRACELLKEIMIDDYFGKDDKQLVNKAIKEFFADEASKHNLDGRISINYWTDAPIELIFDRVNSDSTTFKYELTVSLDKDGSFGDFNLNTVGSNLGSGRGFTDIIYITESLQDSFEACAAICDDFVDFINNGLRTSPTDTKYNKKLWYRFVNELHNRYEKNFNEENGL